MINYKQNLALFFSTIIIIVGWGIWWLLKSVLTTSWFDWYPSIPLFFYILGMLFIYILTKTKKDDPRKLANLYMLLKFTKIAFSLIFAGMYLLFVKDHVRDFSVVFVAFYLLYLGLETYIFYRTEKEIKKSVVDEKLT